VHLVPDSCTSPYQGRSVSEQVPSLPHVPGWDVAPGDEVSPVQVSQDLGRQLIRLDAGLRDGPDLEGVGQLHRYTVGPQGSRMF
jgi:hypothetical protein